MPPKVGDFLGPEQARELGRKSNLAGALLVAHTWALIAGSMALFTWWPNPFTFLVGVMVTGLCLGPYRVNYHLEHHLFMFVPYWRLAAAHRALIVAGRRNEMELQPGYLAVLRRATSKRADAAGDSPSRWTTQHI